MPANFTLQDIFGALFAFALFPLTLLFPGYVIGWALDLFDFKRRSGTVQIGTGLILSFTVSPIILYLTSSLISISFTILTLFLFALTSAVIFTKTKLHFKGHNFTHDLHLAVWVGALWVLFVILSLVDIQWKNQLYYSVVSFDQSTRVSIVDAMTRTGVPPINPGYYPGKPVQLTFLYFFWYILCSVIDVIGRSWVDARMALIASSAWCGLGLMSAIALYLCLRKPNAGHKWKSAWIGIGLLSVSGLDIIPVALLMVAARSFFADIENWNAQITAWAGSILWVPHHIAAMIACLVAIMLIQYGRGKSFSRQFSNSIVAGLAFASALGLSVWVTLIFVVFWGFWFIALLLQKAERKLIAAMVFTGLTALILSYPFLVGLFQGSGSGMSQFPIAFEVRPFLLLGAFLKTWPQIWRTIAMLAILPINYLLELGFYFIVGIFWFKLNRKEIQRSNPFHLAEVLLLAIVFVFGSFIRSTLIANNDFGWRAWLPGQFILLVWSVDVLETLVFNTPGSVETAWPVKFSEVVKVRRILLTLAMVGILTSAVDILLLRFAWPLNTEPDKGQSTYSARLAFEYLRDQIPADAITQNNPITYVDRPSGLYGTHQMVIADRTAYGVSPEQFSALVDEVSVIFLNENIVSWQPIDQKCQQLKIDVLIFKDTDPIWKRFELLKEQRAPLYSNEHYAIFACEKFTQHERIR